MNDEIEIPVGLFRNIHPAPRNDRYVIYKMLNHEVSFKDHKTGEKVSGYVEEVYRDIFSSEIRLRIGGVTYLFKEPVQIKTDSKGLVFVYGDVGKKEVTDKKMFAELKREQFRETASDTFKRMAPRRIKEIRFVLGKAKPNRRRLTPVFNQSKVTE